MSQKGTVSCRSTDLSESGIRVVVDAAAGICDKAQISIRSDFGVDVLLDCTLVWSRPIKSGEMEAAFSFVEPASEVHHKLVQLMFSGDRSWIEQGYPKDRVWRSFWQLVTTFWRVSAPSGRDQLQLKPRQS